MGKVVKAFSGDEIQFMDPIGLGESISFYLVVFAEFVCAIFLILGLFTRLAALVLIINFAVIFHLKWVINQSPIGDIEHIVFYFFIFIALFISGAGKFSLDKVLYSKNK
ncbi:MAG: DoxX family protein [Bacteroidetes bacterium]|nr:DoxX family protein [Bacteroidota bacterium]